LYFRYSGSCSTAQRIPILHVGANSGGKSTLFHLITGALQPVEGTRSKHANLKLAKYSQHSQAVDQLPYESSPFKNSSPKSSRRRMSRCVVCPRIFWLATHTLPGVARTTWPIWSLRFPSDIAHPAALGQSAQPV